MPGKQKKQTLPCAAGPRAAERNKKWFYAALASTGYLNLQQKAQSEDWGL